MSALFPGFTTGTIDVGDGITIHHETGGSGPPLLLLHGYPQTHVMWHRIAPRLAERFTVVCPDLRGYGDSSKPAGSASHVEYAKRTMALDQVRLMTKLGFDRFALVGHDRGARVSHRLARDHGERVTRLALLDIVPTLRIFETVGAELAQAYFHWFFLIQPTPKPEHTIGLDPQHWLRWMAGSWGTKGTDLFDPRAFAEYERCFCQPETIHATCEDYRAAASLDLEHDRADAGQPLAMPVQVLWGAHGVVHRLFDPIAELRRVATDVRGKALPGGHFLAEEVPEQVLAELTAFLG
jgi:haloacetate dehalogenase